MKKDDVSHLNVLGNKKTEYKFDTPSENILEVFQNQFVGIKYEIEIITSEFTSLCPKTSQPDYATITIRYIPDQSCIETKSLKLYLFSFRSHPSFMETINNTILFDLVKVCGPLSMVVLSEFNSRGGIKLNVKSSYEK